VRVVLYIAQSIDGYIADEGGGVSFLDAFHTDGEDYGYDAFFASVDTLLMGRKTYAHVLAMGPWPYGERRTVVLTKGALVDVPTPAVRTFSGEPAELVDELRASGADRAWLVGGGDVVRAFLDADLVDEMQVFTVPRMLGDGVPLFPPSTRGARAWRLTKCETFASGLVGTHHRRVGG